MASNVWFTSDLHLGHGGMCRHRDFDSLEEHDWTIIAQMQAMIKKRDKVFILGDVVWNQKSLELLDEIPGEKELIIGNHDTMTTRAYLKYFRNVRGFRSYKDFWLSHCPVHPQEVYRRKGNIHGHIHNKVSKDLIAAGYHTQKLDGPYFNVNVDFHDYAPVNFDTILEEFNK